MMEAYLPLMKASAMVTAGELGVFHHLHRGPATAEDAAHALGAHAGGMRALLDGLAAFGLLTRNGAHYANTPFVRDHFTPAAKADFTPGLLWTAEARRLMHGLTDAVRLGGPTVSMWEQMKAHPRMGELFSRYMAAFARYFSDDVQASVELPPGARRLLDVGGAHGLHSVAFCRRYPALTSVVFDFPDSLHATAAVLAEQDLSDRITLRPGDAVADELGTGFDAVLLLSVLHNQDATQTRTLLHKAFRALEPGGLLVIHEHFQGQQDPLPFASAFMLTLLVEVGTSLHDYATLQAALREAGFTRTERRDLHPLEKGSIILAWK